MSGKRKMKRAFEMEYKHPVSGEVTISMVPYSSEYQEKYKKMYNKCYHDMREALDIKPYDFIQDYSFFAEGMDEVYLLIEESDLIGSVALKSNEIDNLLVDIKFQGRGYGKQILLWALKHIGAERVILHVAEWNERAINLYKKNGFEITEIIDINP